MPDTHTSISSHEHGSRPYRIIHVDDDASEHLVVRKMLSGFERPGFQVDAVEDFSDALERMQSSSYDVGLIDYHLGGATGLDLLDRLGGRHSATPLVILTGRGDHDVDVEATNAGAFDYLDKNELSPALLERTIRNVRVRFETEYRLRESEERLREAKFEAEAANAAKSEFLASMSHDLRTPLNAILGFSEVVREEMLGPIGNERYVDYAADIYDSGKLLLSMINDVLDLSRIEAGRSEMNEEEIDLQQAVSTAIKLIGHSAAEASQTVEVNMEGRLPPLRADRRMVDRMLFNLLSNASKFTPNGGWISVGGCLRSDGLELSVEDNGIGIPEGEIEWVLQPFGQIAKSSNTSSGIGLGLTIVCSLIDLHGGRFALEKGIDSGTRAVLSFPLDRVIQR